MEQCHLSKLHVDFPAIVIDCGGNIAKAFNSSLQGDWLRYGCHLIHNVIKAGLDSLNNHATNPAQTTVALLQEALDRSVVLSFHCILAQMICMVCQKNMFTMCCIPSCSLCMYIFGNVHGPLYLCFSTLASMFLHLGFCNLVCFGIGLKRLSPMCGSPHMQPKSSTTCKK